jgi:hypothetical protein
MPSSPTELSKPKLLIGEGREEELFFTAFLAYLNISDVQVEQYGGKQALPRYLRTLRLRPGYLQIVSLGITRDADNSAQSAFQSICTSLSSASLPVPRDPGAIAGGSPQVSILILPDNQNSGMLEDLCLAAIETDPALQCVDEYLECIYKTIGRKPNNMAKARVHAWLSSQIEPDKRLGEAAKANYWPWNSPGFDCLKQFLQAL